MSSSKGQVEVVVNGREMAVREGRTLRELLEELGIGTRGVAVELNREIVPKGMHGTTLLKGGDRIEVIRMVGGG